jgi:hypothetical protein
MCAEINESWNVLVVVTAVVVWCGISAIVMPLDCFERETVNSSRACLLNTQGK